MSGLKTEEYPLIIRQSKSMSTVKIPILIQGTRVEGIIDTASEVTIISDTLYESLENKPAIKKEITLNAAGRDMSMKRYLLDQVHLHINGIRFYENVYVAPLQDAMLIRLDFMMKHKVKLDLNKNLFV
jgi:hypothetical protein